MCSWQKPDPREESFNASSPLLMGLAYLYICIMHITKYTRYVYCSAAHDYLILWWAISEKEEVIDMVVDIDVVDVVSKWTWVNRNIPITWCHWSSCVASQEKLIALSPDWIQREKEREHRFRYIVVRGKRGELLLMTRRFSVCMNEGL